MPRSITANNVRVDPTITHYVQQTPGMTNACPSNTVGIFLTAAGDVSFKMAGQAAAYATVGFPAGFTPGQFTSITALTGGGDVYACIGDSEVRLPTHSSS